MYLRNELHLLAEVSLLFIIMKSIYIYILLILIHSDFLLSHTLKRIFIFCLYNSRTFNGMFFTCNDFVLLCVRKCILGIRISLTETSAKSLLNLSFTLRLWYFCIFLLTKKKFHILPVQFSCILRNVFPTM